MVERSSDIAAIYLHEHVHFLWLGWAPAMDAQLIQDLLPFSLANDPIEQTGDSRGFALPVWRHTEARV
jgi:hypothetical protein